MIIPSTWNGNQPIGQYKVDIQVDTKELDEALKKAEKLVELLERAHELSSALPLNSTE